MALSEDAIAIIAAIEAQTAAIGLKLDTMRTAIFDPTNLTSDFMKYFGYKPNNVDSEEDKRQNSVSNDTTVAKYQKMLMEFNAHKHLEGGSTTESDIYGWTWVYDAPPPMLKSVRKQEGAREDPFTP